MRPLLLTFLLTAALFSVGAAYSQLVANSRFLARSSTSLRDWALAIPEPRAEIKRQLLSQLDERVSLYDDEVVKKHLVDGMLVNWTLHGRMLDQCDSLLFSALRYTALHKLGREPRASDAWNSIQSSQTDGYWLRHPRCHKSTSRDMIVGLMVALSQKPFGYAQHLKTLLARVKQHNGYFGTGPVYVSYATPGVAKLMGMLAAQEPGIAAAELPTVVTDGYSTNEIQMLVTQRGYAAHLIALTIWLEMELQHGRPEAPKGFHEMLDDLTLPFGGGELYEQRYEWSTNELVKLDPRNLFFRYLRLRAAGALTPPVAYRMMAELLGMEQFPQDRLPLDCDRRADYLWQRSSTQFEPSGRGCHRQFHGTDFVWMASLLREAASLYTDDLQKAD